MDCERVREHLIDYLYGELSPEVQASVEEALGGCADCAAELAELRKVHELAASMPPLEVPGPVHYNILREARLHADALNGVRRGAFSLKALFTSPALASALVVCLALAVGITLSRQGSAPGDSDMAGNQAAAPSEGATVATAPPSDEAEGPLARVEAEREAQQVRAQERREGRTPPAPTVGTNAARGLAPSEESGGAEEDTAAGEIAEVAEGRVQGGDVSNAEEPSLGLQRVGRAGGGRSADPAADSAREQERVPRGAAAAEVAADRNEGDSTASSARRSRSRADNGDNGDGWSPEETSEPARTRVLEERSADTTEPGFYPLGNGGAEQELDVLATPSARPAADEPATAEDENLAQTEEGGEVAQAEHLETWNYGRGFDPVPRSAGGDSDWAYGDADDDVPGAPEPEVVAEREALAEATPEPSPAQPQARNEGSDYYGRPASEEERFEDQVAVLDADEAPTLDIAAERQIAATQRAEAEEERRYQAERTRDALGGERTSSRPRTEGEERPERSADARSGVVAGADDSGGASADGERARAADGTSVDDADDRGGLELTDTYERAVSRYNDGSYREAVALFDDFIQNAPRTSSAYALAEHYRGIAAFRVGDYGSAVQSLSAVIASPGFERADEARYYLAQTFEALGRLDDAEVQYRAIADSARYRSESDQGIERLRETRRARRSTDSAAPTMDPLVPVESMEVE